MASRWIWWPSTATKKDRVTKETVIFPKNEDNRVFVLKGEQKAEVVPRTRLFTSKEAAEEAIASQGKLGWGYILGIWRHQLEGGKVVRVRCFMSDYKFSSYYVMKPVDAKGQPLKDATFQGYFFETKDAAQKHLAERLRVRLDEVENDLSEVTYQIKCLRKVAKQLEAEGCKIPTTRQVQQRVQRRRAASLKKKAL